MGEFLGKLEIKITPENFKIFQFGDFSASARTYHVFDRPPAQNWFLKPTVELALDND
jgi:hypothetical protein